MQNLELEIKELIISSLSLEDIQPKDIDVDAPLFVDGLGLDSIDALELGVALQKRYGVTMSGETTDIKKHFQNVKSLANFVSDAKKPSVNAGQSTTP